MNSLKIEIFNHISELLDKGYEIKLTKGSIDIVEVFKSISREEYTEKNVLSCYGSLKYFENGTLRITAEKFKRVLKEINPLDK